MIDLDNYNIPCFSCGAPYQHVKFNEILKRIYCYVCGFEGTVKQQDDKIIVEEVTVGA